MPPDIAQAISGQEYTGVFELRVERGGTLSNIRIEGEGWTVLSTARLADPLRAEPGLLRIPFRAVPTDADKPIRLSLTYNGRLVTQAYEIGPKRFARKGKRYRSSAVQQFSMAVPPQPALGEPIVRGDGSADGVSRGGIPLRVVGRIVYTRACRDLSNPRDGDCDDEEDIPATTVGVDRIDVRVWDSDTVGHEEIWSGYTDRHGYFDTGDLNWVDSGDDPDLVLYYETETVDLDVTDNSVWESTYEFESDEATDFTGSFYDFGWHSPANTGLHPAFHIFNSLVRARRFIATRPEYGASKVQVEWPDNSRSGGAWFEYYSDMSEIHISTQRQWSESTHTHEYGHHFMNQLRRTPEPDYCNVLHGAPSYCDDSSGVPGCYEDPTGRCGHCQWCEETDHDAWNEGWPNWLADVVLRSYPDDYEFDDGTPYKPLYTRSQEGLGTCCQDGQMHSGLITEGFVGALLRDIEDDTQDDHDSDGIMDSLCLGVQEIFDIQVMLGPITPGEFISDFLAWYPDETDGLWPTAFNVSPAYVTAFPADATPPGTVASCDSPTHPIGVGGTMPCITVEWEPAPDDVMGVCAYSYRWDTESYGYPPDQIADVTTWTGCRVSATGAATYLGEYYLSIRAMGCDNVWSPIYKAFGPFVVNECNDNGILDICEIPCTEPECDNVCDVSLLALETSCLTSPSTNFCDIFWPATCGSGNDCNSNVIPDDCDIASGFSEDCNLNDIPDECENMSNWDGTSGSWHTPGNWVKEVTPTAGEEICIDVPGNPTVVYSNGALGVGTLACSESLNIVGGSSPWADLTVNDASWIDGSLGLSGNNTVLEVTDRLDVGGLFTWTGSNVTNSAKLTGAGETHANGGTLISAVVHLDGHKLILGGNSTSVCTGRVDFPGSSTFEIRAGSTYEYQGSGYIVKGWFDDNFVNDGTLIKSVDPGDGSIYMFTNNSGLIHVQAGTLKFYLGGSSTGDFLADSGTTLRFTGGQEFLPGSSIVADVVMFDSGFSQPSYVRGTYNLATSTTQSGNPLTFTDEADIISYGSSFYIPRGTVNFDAIIDGTIQFDTLSVGPGASGAGTANFNSGDAVEVDTLTLGPGTISGPGTITVNGLLTWRASGHFRGPGIVNANGDVMIESGGGEKTLYNRLFNNAGHATFLGGFRLSGESVLNNLPDGVIDIQVDSGATVIGPGTLNNAGTLVKTAGAGTSTLSGDVTNTGIVEVRIGVLEFYTYYGYFYVQTAGQTVLNGGDLSMFGPAPLQINGGKLTGVGIITGNVVNAGGTVEPGASVGQLDVVGAYTQGSGGSYNVELEGSMVGEFDVLACTGNVSLAGDLDVVLINNFVPGHCDSFPIITAGSVSGQFDSLSVTNLPFEMELQVEYTANAVTLVALGTPSNGDCDGDCDWDSGDFADLVYCMAGPTASLGVDCSCADLDDDNDVDLRDVAEFQSRFTGSTD